MSEVAWQLEHSIETAASVSFTCKFWTDIANWDDPPAKFTLDGPLAGGSRGRTFLPGQDPLQWHIREARFEEAAAIDMPLDRALLSFEWRFEALSKRRTRLTQRVVLSGENAAAYLGQVRAGFGANLPAGMKRIAAAVERAEEAEDRG